MNEHAYRSRPGAFEILPACADAARRVEDFIWESTGLSSSWLVQTPEGRVVINTGMGVEALIHRRNFDAIDSSPTRYIILTQAHTDHIGGVDHLRDPATKVIAQAGNTAWQREDNLLRAARGGRAAFAWRHAMTNAARPAAGGVVPKQSRPVPDITFEREYAFELGGLRFELISTPGGETTESCVVWLPEHGICFTGNVFGALFGHIPNLVTIRGDRYRDALQVIESIETVMALEPRRLLYGRHGPIDGRERIREELTRLRDALRYLHDRSVEAMNAGTSVWAAMREIQLPPELEVGEGYGMVAWNVRAIYETYLGWFHHHRTSELYSIPPDGAAPDLVALAGGAEAVAASASERLEAGDQLVALQLAEAALAAEPDSAAALKVALEIHRVLETQAENFWMLSWLRERMRQLRGKTQ